MSAVKAKKLVPKPTGKAEEVRHDQRTAQRIGGPKSPSAKKPVGTAAPGEPGSEEWEESMGRGWRSLTAEESARARAEFRARRHAWWRAALEYEDEDE